MTDVSPPGAVPAESFPIRRSIGELADSHDVAGLRFIAGQQVALRQVAELVARGAARIEVLNAVVNEAQKLFQLDFTALLRYDADGHAFIAAVAQGPPGLEIGERAPYIPDGLVLRVFHSRQPVRVDAYADTIGPGVARMVELGITGGAAAPVIVDGHPWGVLTAMTRSDSVARGLEYGLAEFADLAATAVAAAQAKEDLHSLADEQAALRRIAELVARGTNERDLFDAVTVEASTVLANEATTLVAVVRARTFTVLATCRGPAPVGTTVQVPADDAGVVAEVLRTGESARLDDYPSTPGTLYAHTSFGVAASVAVPVVVHGHVWGILGVAAGSPMPTGTEQRLAQFADLVAAAVVNTQARNDVEQLVEQQVALRQVAELAAQNAPAEQVLSAVAVEASRLAGVDFTTMLRFEPDGSTEIVALDGAPPGVHLGLRASGDGDGATQRIWRTGRPARIDDLSRVSGRWPEIARHHGYTTSAAVPVVIEGALWGALVVVGSDRPLPQTIHAQLTDFAKLTATAISAAQARRELHALADEQAALRRVAELAARGAALAEVFSAVTSEASALLDGAAMALVRHSDDGTGLVVATHASPAPVGLRIPTDPASALTQVWNTGLPARIDDFMGTALEAQAVELGVGAGVAVPVTVEGTVWGALSTSTSGPPAPPQTESRLAQFAELAAAAIASAENRANLAASRARVVATADLTRRRFQRDVHDGAQQRLIHAITALKFARDAIESGANADDLVAEALVNAEQANRDLRDVVRGVLPGALTHGGLGAGIESLTKDLVLPVSVEAVVPRLATAIETTAYFVVAESLTNVVKHASASQVHVRVALDDDRLVVEIVDDGVGGANSAGGTGLVGLLDRVEAVGGNLTIASPVAHGTTVRARLPIDDASAPPDRR